MSKKNFVYTVYPIDRSLERWWHIDFAYTSEHGLKIRAKKYLSRKYKSLEDRENEVVRLLAELQKGYTPRPTHPRSKHQKKNYQEADAPLITQLLRFIEAKTLRKKSIQSYTTKVRNFEKWWQSLGKNTLLTKESGQTFLEAMKCNGTSETANNHRSFLKPAFAYLFKEKLVKVDIFAQTKTFRKQKGGANYFKERQREQIKKWILKDDPALWRAVLLLYYCFIRPGNELTGLKVGDVDLDNNLITVRGENAKNWDTERVVIPKQLQTELKQMKLHDYPLDYYLIGLDGHPTKDRVSVNVWSNRHRKVLKINGFEYGGMKYSLYSWKHTGVVLLAKNKAPMIMIQRQLRHKSIETTQEYLKSLGISDMGELEDLFPNI